jgi:hypothetical protein
MSDRDPRITDEGFSGLFGGWKLPEGDVTSRPGCATAEDVHTLVRDALGVYIERTDQELASRYWAGPEHEYARTWMRQRRTLALALIESVEAIPADLLRLTLLNGRQVEL